MGEVEGQRDRDKTPLAAREIGDLRLGSRGVKDEDEKSWRRNRILYARPARAPQSIYVCRWEPRRCRNGAGAEDGIKEKLNDG